VSHVNPAELNPGSMLMKVLLTHFLWNAAGKIITAWACLSEAPSNVAAGDRRLDD
jgi:hypothetical protein